jgi:hypothetical protein
VNATVNDDTATTNLTTGRPSPATDPTSVAEDSDGTVGRFQPPKPGAMLVIPGTWTSALWLSAGQLVTAGVYRDSIIDWRAIAAARTTGKVTSAIRAGARVLHDPPCWPVPNRQPTPAMSYPGRAHRSRCFPTPSV